MAMRWWWALRRLAPAAPSSARAMFSRAPDASKRSPSSPIARLRAGRLPSCPTLSPSRPFQGFGAVPRSRGAIIKAVEAALAVDGDFGAAADLVGR